jgi:hypothetical protein
MVKSVAVRSAAVRRRFFTVSWVVSLLFVVTVASLWVRSYFVQDSFLLDTPHTMVPLWSKAGSLSSQVIPRTKVARSPWGFYWFRKAVRPNTKDVISSLSDFNIDPNYAGRFGWLLIIPHWALMVPGLVLPTVAAVRRIARRLSASAGFPVERPAPSSPPRV